MVSLDSRVNDELLHLLLRARRDMSALDTAKTLIGRQPIDWSTFVSLAEERSLSPILYDVVREREILPPKAEQSLRQVYVRNAARSTMLFALLEELLQRFAGANIDVILLKGAALAESIYGNAALRPMMDIDILTPVEQLPAAKVVLQEQGFAPTCNEPRPGALQTFESQIRFRRPDLTQTLLELHWGLLDSPYYQATFDFDWWRETARPVRVGSAPALVFGPEAQLLHLCAHMVLHHRTFVWLWLHDITEIMHHFVAEIDWDDLLVQAQKMKLLIPLQQILPHVIEHWAAPMPAAVRTQLSQIQPTVEERRVYDLLTQQRQSVAHHFAADIITLPSWHQKLRYSLVQLFPSPAYMQARYAVIHPPLLPFYYARRWLYGLASLRSLL